MTGEDLRKDWKDRGEDVPEFSSSGADEDIICGNSITPCASEPSLDYDLWIYLYLTVFAGLSFLGDVDLVESSCTCCRVKNVAESYQRYWYRDAPVGGTFTNMFEIHIVISFMKDMESILRARELHTSYLPSLHEFYCAPPGVLIWNWIYHPGLHIRYPASS